MQYSHRLIYFNRKHTRTSILILGIKVITKHSAFTLIETLIVLTFIVGIMGLTLPIGTQLKHRALNLKTRVQLLRYQKGLYDYYAHYENFPTFLQQDKVIFINNQYAKFIATLSGHDFMGISTSHYNPDKICFCEFEAQEILQNKHTDAFQNDKIVLLIRKQLSPENACKKFQNMAKSDDPVDWSNEVIFFIAK